MKFEIKSRYNASVLFSLETESLKLCVEAAINSRARLDGANLVWARLDGASLVGANLDGASLVGARLDGANLVGARLEDTIIRDGITVQRPPLQVLGLTYPVLIWDAHMEIGCEFHALAEWAEFDTKQIVVMDGERGAEFWKAHKGVLLALAASDGRK